MQVHYSMNKLPEINSPVVTLGSFDGVHAGHRAIIRRLKDLAAEVGGSSVLITFDPHPRMVLHPDTAGKGLKLINTREEKIKLLEQAGLDHLIIMEFSRDFSRTSPEDFVKHYLVDKLHAHTIVVGFNHYFGHRRKGNFDSLYRDAGRFCFQVEEIPEQEIQNETVSSTRIRKALHEGNIQRANASLQHHYMITGKFEAGGEPLDEGAYAGLRMHLNDSLKLLPPRGSYAASFHINGLREKALVQIGEDGLKFFALEPGAHPGTGERNIYLHLRISASEERDLPALLDAVRELIY